MPAESLAQTDVVTAERDDSAADIAQKMDDEGVGAVVVVEDDEPVGVVTDRSLALAIPEGVEDRTADDFVSGDVVTLERDAEDVEITSQMAEAKVRRLPVVDDDGSLYGIVTLDDVVSTAGEQLEEAASVIEAQSPDYSPD